MFVMVMIAMTMIWVTSIRAYLGMIPIEAVVCGIRAGPMSPISMMIPVAPIPIGMIVPIPVGMLAPIGRLVPVRIARAVALITSVRMVVTEAEMRIIGGMIVTIVGALGVA